MNGKGSQKCTRNVILGKLKRQENRRPKIRFYSVIFHLLVHQRKIMHPRNCLLHSGRHRSKFLEIPLDSRLNFLSYLIEYRLGSHKSKFIIMEKNFKRKWKNIDLNHNLLKINNVIQKLNSILNYFSALDLNILILLRYFFQISWMRK